MLINENYDRVISLGRGCQPAYQIGRLFGRDQPSVFDLLITPDDGLIDAIDSDLSEFFSRDSLARLSNGRVHDTRSQIVFFHEFLPEADIEQAHAANAQRIELLVAQWRAFMRTDNRVLFVRQHAWNPDPRASAIRLRATLRAYAPNLSFTLLYLTENGTEVDSWNEPGILNRPLPQPDPFHWKGDNAAWDRILVEVLAFPPGIESPPVDSLRHVL